MKAVMLAPEAPYPLRSGGAYRTASLLNCLAEKGTVDLILFSETGQPALLPERLVRRQQVIRLPHHSRNLASRYLRNARRALLGVPPLIDRLAGFDAEVDAALGGERYDIAIVEHFWCAPYLAQMRRAARNTILDLHNVESVLDERCADWSSGAVRAGHRRFAAAYRRLETELLPGYSLVLAASETDADTVRQIAPGAKIAVYPNALPLTEIPGEAEQNRLVFSANFEYHPNIDATRFLVEQIWPRIHKRHPDLELWLVGRGEASIQQLVSGVDGIHVTGPVEDALAEIARARIVVAPLRFGSGTRIKILEAWAAGRAVIATPLAAEGLEFRDRENLWLAENADAFISAVENLLADPVACSRLGAAGSNVCKRTYSWAAACESLGRTLETTLLANI
jgi:glycosyltransferase involved in cell wall biosynthesis